MIGIFGGTFDPIHFGHLRSALEVQQRLSLQEVRLVPCRLPPHRDPPIASVSQRVEMIKLATNGLSNLVLDKRELDRDGPSYMVDTLVSFRSDFSHRPLCLIIGMDAFGRLPDWHRWAELVDYAHIVVLTRPGSHFADQGMPDQGVLDSDVLSQLVSARKITSPDELADKPAGAIYFLQITQLEISASSIREQLAQGCSPKFLLPGRVLRYIEQQRIYLD